MNKDLKCKVGTTAEQANEMLPVFQAIIKELEKKADATKVDYLYGNYLLKKDAIRIVKEAAEKYSRQQFAYYQLKNDIQSLSFQLDDETKTEPVLPVPIICEKIAACGSQGLLTTQEVTQIVMKLPIFRHEEDRLVYKENALRVIDIALNNGLETETANMCENPMTYRVGDEVYFFGITDEKIHKPYQAYKYKISKIERCGIGTVFEIDLAEEVPGINVGLPANLLVPDYLAPCYYRLSGLEIELGLFRTREEAENQIHLIECVKAGLENGSAQIIRCPDDPDKLACQIGDDWVMFPDSWSRDAEIPKYYECWYCPEKIAAEIMHLNDTQRNYFIEILQEQKREELHYIEIASDMQNFLSGRIAIRIDNPDEYMSFLDALQKISKKMKMEVANLEAFSFAPSGYDSGFPYYYIENPRELTMFRAKSFFDVLVFTNYRIVSSDKNCIRLSEATLIQDMRRRRKNGGNKS